MALRVQEKRAIRWERARWAALYVLAVHGDTHFHTIQKFAQARFGIELDYYMLRRFRQDGVLRWPDGRRHCHITEEGREELAGRREPPAYRPKFDPGPPGREPPSRKTFPVLPSSA